MTTPAKYRVVFALLVAFVAIVTLTHLGNRSPYTYGWSIFGKPWIGTIESQAVNPDALSIVPLTIGFLKPCGLDFHAPNIFLPIHSMIAACVIAFTHSYMLSNWILNFATLAFLAFVIVKVLRDERAPPAAIVVIGLSILSVPWVANYVGQPMQYTFGICVDALLVVSVIRQSERRPPEPALVGVACALLMLTYDGYVYVAAIVLYVLAFRRFQHWLDYVVMPVVAFAPRYLWDRFIAVAGGADLKTRVSDEFTKPILAGWTKILKEWKTPSIFYAATQIGWDLIFKETIAVLWWPLVLVVLVVLARDRRRLMASSWTRMCICIAIAFAAEQFVAGPFDWEQNPRRALPMVLVFSVAIARAVSSTWHSIGHRAVFGALAIVSVTLSFADTAFHDPFPALMETNQMIRAEPASPMKYANVRLDDDKPRALLPREGPLPIGKFAPVCGKLYDPSWRALASRVPKLEPNPPNTSSLTAERIRSDYDVALFACAIAAAGIAWAFFRGRLIPWQAGAAALAFVVASFVARHFY